MTTPGSCRCVRIGNACSTAGIRNAASIPASSATTTIAVVAARLPTSLAEADAGRSSELEVDEGFMAQVSAEQQDQHACRNERGPRHELPFEHHALIVGDRLWKVDRERHRREQGERDDRTFVSWSE